MIPIVPILLSGAALASAALLGGCSELTTPPTPRCRPDQHLSAGRCCPAGQEWVPARSGCVCVAPSVCGRGAGPGAAEHAATAPPAAAAPCAGTWTGALKSSIGARGTVTINFTPMAPGTLKRPRAASCGKLTERWRGRDGCWLDLVRCARNGPLLIARGSPSTGSGCEAPINLTIRCDDDGRGGYRRTEHGLRVSGTLERDGAASAPHRGAPARAAPAKKKP